MDLGVCELWIGGIEIIDLEVWKSWTWEVCELWTWRY